MLGQLCAPHIERCGCTPGPRSAPSTGGAPQPASCCWQHLICSPPAVGNISCCENGNGCAPVYHYPHPHSHLLTIAGSLIMHINGMQNNGDSYNPPIKIVRAPMAASFITVKIQFRLSAPDGCNHFPGMVCDYLLTVLINVGALERMSEVSPVLTTIQQTTI